jgi:putative NIF3 family GTP cyclohydrolase 1 type 2
VVVRKVAVCGGSGASLIKSAIKAEADIIITGDVKYHDFTTYANDIIIADIGHYESELCTKKIFKRIISEKFVNFVVYLSEKEKNPIKHI